MRVGIGYDVHKLVKGYKLILGGVKIAYKKGLSGWSDADVLTHAIIDALVGAAAEGDIGMHFPSTDKRYKGISSLKLLKEINGLLKGLGYKIVNIDSTIVAEEPRLSPYVEDMRLNLARVLDLNFEQVNVKYSSPEGLGFLGQGKGMSAYAVCLIDRT